jgi:hypothetical protein
MENGSPENDTLLGHMLRDITRRSQPRLVT